MRAIPNFGFLILIVSLFGGCFTPPTYPVAPQIEILNNEICFVKSTKPNEIPALVVNLKFTDGDGDLGLAESDTVGNYVFRNFFTYQNRLLTYRTKRLNPALLGSNGKPLPDFVSPYSCTNWVVTKVRGVTDTAYVEYNENYFNIFIDIETQNTDGTFTRSDPASIFLYPSCDTKGFNGRFPVLAKDLSKTGPLDGKMTYSMRTFGFEFFAQKTLRLKIRIKDRALNTSNEVVSTPFKLESLPACSQ